MLSDVEVMLRSRARADIQRVFDAREQYPNVDDAVLRALSGASVAEMQAARFIEAGVMPQLSHRETVWMLARYAAWFGFFPEMEERLPHGANYLYADLVVRDLHTDDVRWVIEVKTNLDERYHVTAAVRQVKRYQRIIEDGAPVVACYGVDTEVVDGVLVCSTAELRRMMKQVAA